MPQRGINDLWITLPTHTYEPLVKRMRNENHWTEQTKQIMRYTPRRERKKRVLFTEWKHQLEWNASNTNQCMRHKLYSTSRRIVDVIVGDCCWGFSNFLFLFRSLGLDFILVLSNNKTKLRHTHGYIRNKHSDKQLSTLHIWRCHPSDFMDRIEVKLDENRRKSQFLCSFALYSKCLEFIESERYITSK